MSNSMWLNLRRKGVFGMAIALTVLGVALAWDLPYESAFLVGALILLVINLTQVGFAQLMIYRHPHDQHGMEAGRPG